MPGVCASGLHAAPAFEKAQFDDPQGMALKGSSYTEILAHYYVGTAVSNVGGQ